MSKLVIILLITLGLQAQMITKREVQMGSLASVTLNEEDKHYFKTTFKLLHLVEDSLSSDKRNSPIYRLNANKKATINLYTSEALTLSREYYKKTGGYFDVAVGSITKNLYNAANANREPESWELNASDISLSSLSFDERKATIAYGIKLDLSGMEKGFGIDAASNYLRINGVKSARIDLDGDIRCLGVCRVAIKNPFISEALATFETKETDIGISTTGNYKHLINPKTKLSQHEFISITLISKLPSSDLDAYVTAASVMPKELAYKFLESIEVGYITLQTDGTFHISPNIDRYVNDLDLLSTLFTYKLEDPQDEQVTDIEVEELENEELYYN